MGYTGDKKREYDRLWMAKRRQDWIDANGPCTVCGSTKELEVDHIIQRKIGGGLAPAQIWSRRSDVREKELAVCQVLCRSCHKNKTFEEESTKTHGATMYQRGCRCKEYTNAQVARVYAWRKNRFKSR